MNRNTLASALLFSLLTLTSAAFADTKSDLQAMYDKLDKLMLKKDIPAIEDFIQKITTEDFKYTGSHGEKQNKKGFIAQGKQSLAMFDKVQKSKAVVKGIKVQGGLTLATVSSEVKFATAKDPNGATHVIEAVETSTDTWKKVGTAWKLVAVKVTKSDTKMDGKPLDPSMMGGGN